MTLVDFKNILMPAIEAQMHMVVDQALSEEKVELRKMITYHLGWEGQNAGPESQGKRIRPLLVLLSTCALNGSWQSALPAAAAIELVHNFSLIHDDIQDKSELRHNRPTIWVKWGIPQAINAGDTMYTLAQLAMLETARLISPTIALKASTLLNQACISLTYGQFLDLSYEDRLKLSLDDYWPMIEGKTAALMATCTELGALIANAPPNTVRALHDFGLQLGLAFQAQDDLLGIWGKESHTGKSNESDLVSGKKTLPILYAIGQKGAFSNRWAQGPISLQEVARMEALLSSEGAYDYTKTTVDRLTRSALAALDIAYPQKNDGGQALVELTHELLNRQS